MPNSGSTKTSTTTATPVTPGSRRPLTGPTAAHFRRGSGRFLPGDPTPAARGGVLRDVGTISEPLADGAPASYARRPGALLAEALTISAGAADTTATLRQLAELAVEATDADRASFFLVDDGRRTVRLWAA